MHKEQRYPGRRAGATVIFLGKSNHWTLRGNRPVPWHSFFSFPGTTTFPLQLDVVLKSHYGWAQDSPSNQTGRITKIQYVAKVSFFAKTGVFVDLRM
jgi:hypothetical protein